MYQKNSLLETVARIETLHLNKEKTGRYTYALWIIKRYLYYAIEAALNGYQVNIYGEGVASVARIKLVWAVPERLRGFHKKLYLFSNKVFDHMFIMSFSGKYINEKYFIFSMESRLKKRIKEKLDSDSIYQFVKQ